MPNPSSVDHSPLPWSLKQEGDTLSVVDANGQTVCDNMDYYPQAVKTEDMQLIVEMSQLFMKK